MGLYDRDYMRRARTDAEERTGRPAWLETRGPVARGTTGKATLLAIAVSAALLLAAHRLGIRGVPIHLNGVDPVRTVTVKNR